MQKRRCQAVHPESGKRCEHKQDHAGPHRLFRRRSEAGIVTWEDPPLDPKEIVGVTFDARGMIAYTRDRAGDFLNAMSKGVASLLRRDDGKVHVVKIDDPDDAIEGGGGGAVKATHGEPLDAETVRKHRILRCWSCSAMPVAVESDRGWRLICPNYQHRLSACQRSLRASSRRELWTAIYDWNQRQRDRA